jgi:methyltransferase (TIGR00027 family)
VTALRDVSDTALWVATFRAEESARKKPLFRDPFAATLVGEEGPRLVRSLGYAGRISGGVVVRTVAFDEFIRSSIAERGIDAVVNLGAGLDARPYRMDLPPTLRWWEIDLPRLLDFKEARLAGHVARCDLRRLRVDLRDAAARRAMLGSIATECKRALVVTEGLLPYLAPNDAATLAREIAEHPSFAFWAADLVADMLLDYSGRRKFGKALAKADAPFRFAPKEGVRFFEAFGFRVVEQRNPIFEAYRLHRVPWFMRVLKPLVLLPPREGTHMASWAKAGSVLLERRP